MARAVGRRLSSMLQIPVGYDLKGPKMETIPDMEPTPPQKRRESVTVGIIIEKSYIFLPFTIKEPQHVIFNNVAF